MKIVEQSAGLDRCVSRLQTVACAGLLKPLASVCAHVYAFCYRHVHQLYVCFIAYGIDVWMKYEFSALWSAGSGSYGTRPSIICRMWYSLDASYALFAVLFLGARLLQMFVWLVCLP
jgi:hypothetical protein